MNAAIYHIGKLAKSLGISQRSIRYYEELGFITPTRTLSGYRQYSQKDHDILKLLLQFKNLGLKLNEIQSFFSKNSTDGEKHIQYIEQQLQEKRISLQEKISHYHDAISFIDDVLKMINQCNVCQSIEDHISCTHCLQENASNNNTNVRIYMEKVVKTPN